MGFVKYTSKCPVDISSGNFVIPKKNSLIAWDSVNMPVNINKSFCDHPFKMLDDCDKKIQNKHEDKKLIKILIQKK